jgi:glycosyltransferase involved in cell wall biosynthesis
MEAEYARLDVELHVLSHLHRPFSPFFPRSRLKRIAAAAQPKLVHIQNPHGLRAGLVSARAARAPAVLTVHMPLAQRGLRPCIRAVNGIIAVSEAVREDLVNSSRIPKDKIRVIPDGLDLAQYRPCPFRDAKVPVIATAGALEPRKAQKDFLTAAKQVLDAGRQAQFLIIGDGPEESRLRRHAAELGVHKSVTFVTNVTDFRQPLSTCDVFVLPSLMEGLGLVVLQAMALAKPVVTTSAGGLCLIVTHGHNGLLVSPNAPAEIAAAVLRLLENPGLAQALGANARQFVEAEFSIVDCVDKTLAYFHDIRNASS